MIQYLAIRYSDMLLSSGLSLRWYEWLFHFANFLILVIAFRLLLYKPVLKFLNKRKENIEKLTQENEQLKVAQEQMQSDYANQLAVEKKALVEKANEVTKAAELNAKEIIRASELNAKEIIKLARAEAELEHHKLQQELRVDMPQVVANLVSTLLKRTITYADNQKIIDECLDEWSRLEQ